MPSKNIIRFAIAAALLLLVPLVFRWPWSLSDFVVAGVLLFGAGLTYEFVARRIGSIAYRTAVGIAVAAARAMFAMAIVQLFVPVIALLVWNRAVTSEPPGVIGVFILNAIFAALFVGSALLFQRADHQRQLNSPSALSS